MGHESLKAVISIFDNVQKVIKGKSDQIKNVLACWLSGGHVLIEDVPGTGKTMLARAIAKSVQVEFKRAQFTPDLLPSDILGGSIYNQHKQTFEFIPGPVFTTVFLGDELNRASPRTQSALLECMAEGQVSIEGKTQNLDSLFFVMATQNPVEQQGTFPLPEAQLDRFMMKISLGYMLQQEEVEMLKGQNRQHPIHQLRAVAAAEDLEKVRSVLPEIQVSDSIFNYIMELVGKTRKSPDLKLGASPRASLALTRCAQTLAFFDGLDHVRPQHVFKLIQPVVSHRLMLTADARLAGKTVLSVLDEIVKQVRVPVE